MQAKNTKYDRLQKKNLLGSIKAGKFLLSACQEGLYSMELGNPNLICTELHIPHSLTVIFFVSLKFLSWT